jgi:alcohol dehydrogenase (cytochrome c)
MLTGGCSSTTSTTATSPPASMPPLSSTPASGPTYGSLSQQGQVVYSNNCAGCHGANGQGITAPAIIGASANLGKYNTGKGLLDFISAAMPLSSPGSLSHQDYLNVLSYLLVQNNYAFPATAFNESALANIQLK